MTPVNKLFSDNMGRRVNVPKATFQPTFYIEWAMEEMAGNPLDAPHMLPYGGVSTERMYLGYFEQPAVPRGWW